MADFPVMLRNVQIGTGGDDRLLGSADDNTLLDGGGGFDWLWGYDGDDVLIAKGTGIYQGGEGIDILILDLIDVPIGGDVPGRVDGPPLDGFLLPSENGTPVGVIERDIEQLDLTLGASDDRFIWGVGDQTVRGGAGDDEIDLGTGTDALYGGAGNDVLRVTGYHFVAEPFDVIDGGDGFDRAEISRHDSAYDLIIETAPDGSFTFSDRTVVVGIEELWVTSGSGNDQLRGGNGDDQLVSGDGDDLMEGGAGNDRLFSSTGNDTLRGGDGDDELGTDEGAGDLLDGGAGTDTARISRFGLSDPFVVILNPDGSGLTSDGTALVGIERLNAHGSMGDTLIGANGDDWLSGSGGGNTLRGRGGDDVLASYSAADVIDGGDGVDRAIIDRPGPSQNPIPSVISDLIPAGLGGPPPNFAFDGRTGLGSDGTVVTGVESYQITSGWGNDTLIGGSGDDTLDGQGGNDVLNGGEGSDTVLFETRIVLFDALTTASFNGGIVIDLAGGVVFDRANGSNGWHDTLVSIENAKAGWGDDLILGSAVENRLVGDNGDDALWGFGGDDALTGDYGDDVITGGAGDDTAEGGDGVDVLFGGDFAADGSRNANSGDDALNGGADGDALWGFDGNDTVEGGAGNDYLEGGAGHDVVLGGADNDTVLADAGSDWVHGGAGFDYLYGGAGADTFAFRRGDSYDTIWDFSAAENDHLHVDRALGAQSFGELQARMTGYSYGGHAFTEIFFAETNDKLIIRGIAPSEWTEAMVTLV
jgi:Ca2+-binding RTX toxin-like protein